MTMQPRLATLISDGWTAHPRGICALEDAPLLPDVLAKIQSNADGKATHVVLLLTPDRSETRWFAITNDADLAVAREQEAAGWTIIGYHMRITCGGRSLDGEVRIELYARIVEKVTKWEVKANEGDKTFDVFFKIEGDDKSAGDAKIAEVENVLLALAVKNRICFEVWNIGWGPLYAAQPIGIWAGRPENVPREIDESDIATVRRYRDEGRYELLLELVRFFGQVTDASRIVFGFSILQKLYDDEPEHALSNDELRSVLNKIDEIEVIAQNKSKRDKLRKVIADPAIISKKNRNQRIAAKLATEIGIPEDDAYRRIRDLSSLRGRAAHSTTSKVEGIADATAFIERALIQRLTSL